MENMGIVKLTTALKKLNAKANIDFECTEQHKIIFGSIPGEDLVMPEGYYYNAKNGITNKHNTESGVYEAYEYCMIKRRKVSFFSRIFKD